jgi:hypothetical protein
MNDLFGILNRTLQGEPTRQIGERLGVDEAQASSAVNAALPALLSALANNTRKRGGLDALAGAIDRDHDGSVLDDLDGLAHGKYDEDGAGILGHVLGGNRAAVEQQVGRFAGLDAGSMGKLLVMLAPLILGMIGKLKKKGDVSGGDLGKVLRREQGRVGRRDRDLGEILGGVLQGGGPGQRSTSGCLGSLLGGLMRRRG